MPVKTESSFASSRCYLSESDVYHHLEGHYSFIVAHTYCRVEIRRQTKILLSASHYTTPKGLCPAGRDWKMAFPSVISTDPPLGAWTLTPVAPMVHIPISSHRTSAFPVTAAGRLPTTSTQWRLLCGFPFGAAVIPLCSGPQVCWPLWSPPQCIKQSGSDFYIRAEHPPVTRKVHRIC